MVDGPEVEPPVDGKRRLPRINWAQAAGEALLIVVGVILALGADALWEARQDREREREYLEALAVELDQMRDYVSGVAATALLVEDSGRELIRVSENWSSRTISTDSLIVLMSNISTDGEWAPPRTVYDDMVSTGAVSLIQSDEVRRGLNELIRELSWVETRQVRHNGFFWDEMEPYFRQHVPILAVFGWGSLQATEPWVPGGFMATREFRNLVAGKGLTAADVRAGAGLLLTVIDRVSGLVEAHAGSL